MALLHFEYHITLESLFRSLIEKYDLALGKI